MVAINMNLIKPFSYKEGVVKSFFEEKEEVRDYFHDTLEKLLLNVKFNIKQRSSSLTNRDVKILQRTDVSLTYLLTMYETDWKVCLPQLVQKYVDKVIETLAPDTEQVGEVRSDPEDYLSICDMALIVSYTDDIIHYLMTEYDPMGYYQKRSWFSKISMYFNSARTVRDGRQRIASSSVTPTT